MNLNCKNKYFLLNLQNNIKNSGDINALKAVKAVKGVNAAAKIIPSEARNYSSSTLIGSGIALWMSSSSMRFVAPYTLSMTKST